MIIQYDYRQLDMVSYFCSSSIRLGQFYCPLIKSNSLSLRAERLSAQGAGREGLPTVGTQFIAIKGRDQISIIWSASDQIEPIEGLGYPRPLSDNWPQYQLSQKIYEQGLKSSGQEEVWGSANAMPVNIVEINCCWTEQFRVKSWCLAIFLESLQYRQMDTQQCFPLLQTVFIKCRMQKHLFI